METWNNQRNRYYRASRCHACRRAGKREAWHRQADEHSVARRKRWAEDEEYRRARLAAQHKSKYGISLDEKDAMLAAQGGVCAVCGTDEPKGHGWVTDHDHACCPTVESCGKCIRGILCNNCNLALGHAKDSVERLTALIAYLTKKEMSTWA